MALVWGHFERNSAGQAGGSWAQLSSRPLDKPGRQRFFKGFHSVDSPEGVVGQVLGQSNRLGGPLDIAGSEVVAPGPPGLAATDQTDCLRA